MVGDYGNYRVSVDPADSADTVLDLRVVKRTEKMCDPPMTSNAMSPREVQPRETQPRETRPREMQPRETRPREMQPRETRPRETRPREIRPRHQEEEVNRHADIVRNPPIKEIWEYCYTQNMDGDTRLHIAVIHGCWREVFNLVKIAPHPCLLDIQNNNTQSALHYAVLTGQSAFVRCLVVAGANLMNISALGNTPLHLACEIGNFVNVQALLAPPTMVNWTSFPSNYYKTCVALQNLEYRNRAGKTCLHIAVFNRHVHIVKLLLHMGASLDTREGLRGWTALHIAVYNNDRPMIDFLVNQNSLNFRITDFGGYSPFQLALSNRRDDIAQLLASRCAGIQTPMDMEISSDDDSSTLTGDEMSADESIKKYWRPKKMN